MANVTIPSTGNQIQGLATWAQKEPYPNLRAGGQDATPSALAAEFAAWGGTLNGNWLRIRNFVNQLRADVDAGLAAAPVASSTQTGMINTIVQIFAGMKTFINGVKIGNNTTSGQVIFDSPSGFTSVLGSVHTNNQTLSLPDKSGTLATTSDISGKQDALTSTTDIAIRNIAGTSVAITSTGSYESRLVSLGNTANRTVHLPQDRNGTLVMTNDGVSIAGSGLVENADHSLSPNVDGTSIQISNNKLTAVGGRTVIIAVPWISATTTPFIPLPIGKITRIVCVSEDSNVGAVALNQDVVIIDSLLRIAYASAGVFSVILQGTTFSSITMLGAPQLTLITMVV